jgi:hypothetical protein
MVTELRGYRNMRFLRYTFKKKAVKEICDMLAPSERVHYR